LRATAFCKKRQKRGHSDVIRRIYELTTGTPLRDETCALQGLHVEGQRRGHQVHALGDHARRQTLRPALNQQPEDAQSVLVRQGTKRSNYVSRLHQITILRVIS